MNTLWVVVADQGRARIFSLVSPRSEWQEVDDLVAPDSRLQDHELEADRRGHTTAGGGSGHTMGKRHSLKEQDAIRFAEQLAERVTAGADDAAFGGLVLVAPPRFLGLLRDALPQRISKLVRHSLDKNLVSQRSDEIRNHLPEHL